MAQVTVNFHSHSLGLSSTFLAVIPQPEKPVRKRYPVLYLLHGLSDDHTIWSRRTSIERYADAYGLAVVMPAVGRSFYRDMATGPRYGTYVSQELPAVARSLLPLSDRREDTYVAGLSMGGYGAFLLGLSLPDTFAAAGSFSGALDMAGPHDESETAWTAELRGIFGPLEKIRGSDADLFELARRLSARDRKRLRLYQCCGTEDFLYAANTRFRDHARELRLSHTYEEEPGEHEWGYWDRKVQDFLKWLFGR